MVMDECAFIQEAAWTEALRPALLDRLGRALFINAKEVESTGPVLASLEPWPEAGQVGIVAFSHGVNPFIAASGSRRRRRVCQTGVRAGVSGRFVDDAGGVFRRVMEAATATAVERIRLAAM